MARELAGFLGRPGRRDNFARAALAFNLGTSGGAKRMRADRQLASQLAGAEDLDAVSLAIGEPSLAQRLEVNASAVAELVQRFEIDGDVTRRVPRVVETALGDAADERHLAAFKTDADRAAGTGGLALATAAAGFAVTAGLTLAETLAAMLGARAG